MGETFADFQSLGNIPKRIEVLNMTLMDSAIIERERETHTHTEKERERDREREREREGGGV